MLNTPRLYQELLQQIRMVPPCQLIVPALVKESPMAVLFMALMLRMALVGMPSGTFMLPPSQLSVAPDSTVIGALTVPLQVSVAPLAMVNGLLMVPITVNCPVTRLELAKVRLVRDKLVMTPP